MRLARARDNTVNDHEIKNMITVTKEATSEYSSEMQQSAQTSLHNRSWRQNITPKSLKSALNLLWSWFLKEHQISYNLENFPDSCMWFQERYRM